MNHLEASELIVNGDGSIFHLHMYPEQLADWVLLVGDPDRVKMIATYFDQVESQTSNREFHSITGVYRGIRMTALSTGIGPDNIDIVVNELDALANINLKTRRSHTKKRALHLIRIGTAGSIQPDLAPGQWMGSSHSLGLDGLLHYYAGFGALQDQSLYQRILTELPWPVELPLPYLSSCSLALKELLTDQVVLGINVSAHGFYAPQGRALHLSPKIADLNSRFSNFGDKNQRITHFEMESSALYGLSMLLGHQALTVCLILASRTGKLFLADYKPEMNKLIGYILDRISIFASAHEHE